MVEERIGTSGGRTWEDGGTGHTSPTGDPDNMFVVEDSRECSRTSTEVRENNFVGHIFNYGKI